MSTRPSLPSFHSLCEALQISTDSTALRTSSTNVPYHVPSSRFVGSNGHADVDKSISPSMSTVHSHRPLSRFTPSPRALPFALAPIAPSPSWGLQSHSRGDLRVSHERTISSEPEFEHCKDRKIRPLRAAAAQTDAYDSLPSVKSTLGLSTSPVSLRHHHSQEFSSTSSHDGILSQRAQYLDHSAAHWTHPEAVSPRAAYSSVVGRADWLNHRVSPEYQHMQRSNVSLSDAHTLYSAESTWYTTSNSSCTSLGSTASERGSVDEGRAYCDRDGAPSPRSSPVPETFMTPVVPSQPDSNHAVFDMRHASSSEPKPELEDYENSGRLATSRLPALRELGIRRLPESFEELEALITNLQPLTKKTTMACTPCRLAKRKCDGGSPCSTCIKRCSWHRRAQMATQNAQPGNSTVSTRARSKSTSTARPPVLSAMHMCVYDHAPRSKAVDESPQKRRRLQREESIEEAEDEEDDQDDDQSVSMTSVKSL